MAQHRASNPSFLARLDGHLAPRFGAAGSISMALSTMRRRRAGR